MTVVELEPTPELVRRTTWGLRRGATVTDEGTSFRVWAPTAKRVTVHLATGEARGEYPMSPSEGEAGVYVASVAGVRAGDRYGFRVNDDDPLPDPVSRAQPDGVHGLSQVIDPDAFEWSDERWPGVALPDFVIYEMHVGTFTPAGTFDAAAARLPELRALGITAVELMPVASFPGRRNWGYDGVHLYAPQQSYGGPDGLKCFVNAAHGLGIGVVLDVVYNHVGPEGNYLNQFGSYFTDVYRTPWGRAVNYDGRGSDEVRRWAHDNALYWLIEYHMDALRLDAVHGIFDFGALAFLEELSDEVHGLGRRLGRKMQLLAESDLNDPRLVRSPEQGGYGLDAQWADDVHHTIHATLTGERAGYYQDFAGIATIADAYFTEHGDQAIVDAVREGRNREFPEIGTQGTPIDPQAEESFARSVLNWERRNGASNAMLLRLYTDLIALRREEPALRPGASLAQVRGDFAWCTVVRTMPLESDIFDAVRLRRALWYAFNLSDHEQDIAVPPEATASWRLRLATDAEGYGGNGHLTHVIPDIVHATIDAPKRLIAANTPPEARERTVRLSAWSAAVYVRDQDDEGTR